MPGTPAQYLSDPSTREAEALIDQMISEGASGAVIIDALESASLRIYNTEDIEEMPGEEYGAEMSEGMGEEMAEGMAEEGMEEAPPMGGPMYDEELSELSPGPSMAGGNEGGNRALLIEAVRFGVDEDKKKKAKSKKPE